MGYAFYGARHEAQVVVRRFSRSRNASNLLPFFSPFRIVDSHRRTYYTTLSKTGGKVVYPSARSPIAKAFCTSRSVFASIESHGSLYYENDQPTNFSKESSSDITDIRSRLRRWESENAVHPILNSQNWESTNAATFKSILLLPEDNRMFGEDLDENKSVEIPQPIFEGAELVDFGNQRTFLRRGDLVELRPTEGAGEELAIFIRQLGEQSQFYTMSGKWMHQRSQSPKFFVPGFVDPRALEPLVPFLPDAEVADVLQDKLHSFKYALPRDIGSPLIRKMVEFWRESDTVYRAAASQLDNAHKIVAHKAEPRYAALQELAQEILPKYLASNGDYPTAALYALHRALCMDEIGFRPQGAGHHRTWGQFHISSIDEVTNLKFVADEVRRYQEFLISSISASESGHPTKFLGFIAKAQRLIDESRETRRYTPYGIIGPSNSKLKTSSNPDLKPRDNVKGKAFSAADQCYIRFIESWARYGTFTGQSHLYGIASAILRATGRYEDLQLGRAIGWVFLQELGVIPPWANKVYSELRLPLNIHEDESEISSSTCLDTLNGRRKDWGALPVYCIDSISTQDIDDGLSIEPTEVPDEYWVHIHTADPASEIVPRSAVAQKAERSGCTIYLPERVVPMLPGTLIQSRFSLAPGRPSLTFSARLNSRGDLLAHKVTPGIVHNVVYMTPDTVASVLGQTPLAAKDTVYTVGDDVFNQSSSANRPLQTPDITANVDRKNLQVLHSLAAARQRMTVAKGSIMFFRPNTHKSFVALGVDAEQIKPEYVTSYRYATDPSIQFRAIEADETSKIDIVRDLMLMAGEVAARWCHERSIPIINRVTQRDPDRPDPREYFHTVIKPFLAEEDSPDKAANTGSQVENFTPPEAPNLRNILPADIFQEYVGLLTNVLPSTTAGPHVALGLDMFSRATSPLRRYSDLITHWQIEAALLEEARLGKSLIGSTREDYLPFKKAELDHLIPRLGSRERAVYEGHNASQDFWAIQFLIRAWEFGQAPLPPTFRFITNNVWARKWAWGDLIELGGLRASVHLPDHSAFQKDIAVGDVLEVRIVHLDAYRRRIYVEPLRCVERAEGER